MSGKLLNALQEVFPSEGVSVPFTELKFRFAGPFGLDGLEDLLKQLVDKKVLSTWEFNGVLNYKSLKDLPLTLGAGSPADDMSDNMAKDLSKLLKALAEKSGDSSILIMAEEFSAKYG